MGGQSNESGKGHGSRLGVPILHFVLSITGRGKPCPLRDHDYL
jgi:hypothetical protein